MARRRLFIGKAFRAGSQFLRTPAGQAIGGGLISAYQQTYPRTSASVRKGYNAYKRVKTGINAASGGTSAVMRKGPGRPRLDQRVAISEGTTQSYSQLGAYRPSVSKPTMTLVENKFNGSLQFSCAIGSQGCDPIIEANTGAELLLMLKKVPDTNDANRAGVNMLTSYFYPVSSTSKYYITNFDIANSVIEIYDYVYRRDTSQSTSSMFSDLTDISAPAASSPLTWTVNDPGQTLFDIPMFTNLCKVYKRTRLELRPGASHMHQTSVYHTRRYNPKDFLAQSQAVAVSKVRGLTSGSIIVHQTMPVLDTGTSRTDAISTDSVTFGSTRIGIVYVVKQSMYVLPDNQTRQSKVDSLNIDILNQGTRESDGDFVTGEGL